MFEDQNPTINSDIINAKFKEKGVTLPCPRCGNTKFNLIGESNIALSTPSPLRNLLSAVPSPSSIPVVIIGCANCGYIIQHAKGPLDLLKWHERSPR